jgi:hypothetical protein
MASTESSTHGTPSRSTSTVTSLLTLIDWTALPPETQQTIRTLGPLMQEDCSQSEMARRLGIPDAQVARMRRELADAIVEQCHRLADQLDPKLRGLVDRLRGPSSSTA